MSTWSKNKGSNSVTISKSGPKKNPDTEKDFLIRKAKISKTALFNTAVDISKTAIRTLQGFVTHSPWKSILLAVSAGILAGDKIIKASKTNTSPINPLEIVKKGHPVLASLFSLAIMTGAEVAREVIKANQSAVNRPYKKKKKLKNPSRKS